MVTDPSLSDVAVVAVAVPSCNIRSPKHSVMVKELSLQRPELRARFQVRRVAAGRSRDGAASFDDWLARTFSAEGRR